MTPSFRSFRSSFTLAIAVVCHSTACATSNSSPPVPPCVAADCPGDPDIEQCSDGAGTYYVDSSGARSATLPSVCSGASTGVVNPADAGPPPPPPPSCTGTVMDVCSGLSSDQCARLPECVYGACSGTPCSMFTDGASCDLAGCLWTTRDCVPENLSLECSSFLSPSNCGAIGCTWGSGGPCGVPVSACSALSADECSAVAGCSLAGGATAPGAPSGALIPLGANENAVAILADGTNVYALLAVPAGSCGARWVRAPRDGSSSPVTIWSGSSCGPFSAVDAVDQIFWAQLDGHSVDLEAVAKTGGTSLSLGTLDPGGCLVEGASCLNTSLAADAQGYYWADFGTYSSFGDTGYSCTGSYVAGALRNQTSSVIASNEQCAEVLGEVNGSLYWYAEGNSAGTALGLRTCSTLGGDAAASAPATIQTSSGGGPSPVGIVSGSVYESAGSQITATPLGPGSQVGNSKVVATGLTTGIAIVIAATPTETAWILDTTADGSLHPGYAPASTGTSTQLSATVQGAGLAIDDENVYFATGGYVVAVPY